MKKKMDMDKKWEKVKMVKENLRSVVESCKGGVPFKCLERDYHDLLGMPIPYQEMQYPSLEAMIEDMSDTIILERNNQNTVVVRAVVTDATAHIASLVARQRAAKKPVVGRRRPVRPQSYRSSQRYSEQGSNWKFSLTKGSSTRTPFQRNSSAGTVRTFLPTLHDDDLSYAMPQGTIPSSRRPATSPKQEYSVPPRFKNKETAKSYVDAYASAKNIVAKYITLPMGQKVKSYISTLILDGHKYNSFPNEKKTREEAEEAAACIAKETLKRLEGTENILPIAPVNNEECVSTLVRQIDEIVNENPSGIFSHAVLQTYKLKHQALLPDNWLDVIEPWCTSDILKSEGVTILYPHKSSISGRVTPHRMTSSKSSDNQDDDKGIYNSQLGLNHTPVEQLLEVNFAVFVSCVIDSQNIAVRLVDYYYDAFEELLVTMKEYYSNNNMPVKNVHRHDVYVTFNDGFWNRVSVEEVLSSSVVSCRYVDDGDLSNVNLCDLQVINPEFLKLPFQAVRLKLSGLENISHLVSTDNLVKYLLGYTFIAEMVDREEQSVILYDTSTDVDVNLNNTIKEKTILEALKFSLPKEGSTALAHMRHVSEFGDVYIQFKCQANDPHLLHREINGLASEFEKRNKLGYGVSKHEICCAKYDDNCWYRAIILKYLNNQVKVYYVDNGNTSWVSMSDVCELLPVSKYLAEIPFQVVKCCLRELPPPDLYWHENAVNRLVELVPPEKEVIVKVEKSGGEINCPQVSLYLRNEDSVIISLNQTLAFSIELFSKSPIVDEISREITNVQNNGSSSKERGKTNSIGDKFSFSIPDVAISAEEKYSQQIFQPLKSAESPYLSDEILTALHEFPPLHPPEIPEVGDLFPVYVSMAANPHNFMCQPLESFANLDSLLTKMNEFYSDKENICEMHQCLIKEKHFYAGKHSDGVWYRVRVQNIISKEPLSVSVYFVDFGDYAPLSLSNLQLLWKQFKSLPCQAMKASLSGVKPKDGDWSPEDCIEFRNRVSEKQFFARITAKESFDDDIMECCKLELLLIDTVTDRDIYINEELIDDGMALQCL